MKHLTAVTLCAFALFAVGCSDKSRDQRVDRAISHLCGVDAPKVRWHWKHWKQKTSDDPADSGATSLTAVGCNGDQRVGQVYDYEDEGYIEDDDARTDRDRRRACPTTDSHRVIVENHNESYGKRDDGIDWFWVLRCSGER